MTFPNNLRRATTNILSDDPPVSTRDRVIRAALRVVAMHGAKGADPSLTTKAVAERAGVSESTLYREFGDKAGILGATYGACWWSMNLLVADANFIPEPDESRTPFEVIEHDLALLASLFDVPDDEWRDCVTCAFAFYRRRNDFGLPHHGGQDEAFERRIERLCEIGGSSRPRELALELVNLLVTTWVTWQLWSERQQRVPSLAEFRGMLHEILYADGPGGIEPARRAPDKPLVGSAAR